MDRDGLPRLIVKYEPCGRQSQGQPLKRLLDCWWDQNRSQDPKSCNLYDDDDDMMILCQCFLKPDLLEVHLVFRNEALVTELWRYNPFKSDEFNPYRTNVENRVSS